MNIEEYLSRLDENLEADPLRRDEIRLEVHGHLRERVEELTADGLTREAAEARAIDEFGPPEEYARGLSGKGRMPTWLRMDRQVTQLGWCYVGYAILGTLALPFQYIHDDGLAMAGFEAGQNYHSTAFGAFGVAAILVYFLVGRALVRHRPWARKVALVTLFLHIGLVPLGTILGVYALCVLFHPTVRRRFASS